jgi:hypothetical protein
VSAPDLTYPHDYRLICAGQPPAVVVGGQAVKLNYAFVPVHGMRELPELL